MPHAPRPPTRIARYLVAALAAVGATTGSASAGGLESDYLFRLSDMNGSISMSWPTLSYDAEARELFVNDRTLGEVRVFRDSGMQVQTFGQDEAFGTILDVAVQDDGDLLVLGWKDRRSVVVHCDFRGEPREVLALEGVPASFAKDFFPVAMRLVGGRVYLADKATLKVLVTDERGAYQASYDFVHLLKVPPKKLADARMTGFNVDRAGNVLFTIGPLFTAYIVSPAGEIRSFGTRGSAPGKFNIVGAIATDERGYIFVTDILRAVVMVFDPALSFVGEFGYRGDQPENLVAPTDVAVARGRVFVSQGAARGVSVFRVAIRDAAAPSG